MGPGIGFRDKVRNAHTKQNLTFCELQWGPELGSGISPGLDVYVQIQGQLASMGPGIGFRDKPLLSFFALCVVLRRFNGARNWVPG